MLAERLDDLVADIAAVLDPIVWMGLKGETKGYADAKRGWLVRHADSPHQLTAPDTIPVRPILRSAPSSAFQGLSRNPNASPGTLDARSKLNIASSALRLWGLHIVLTVTSPWVALCPNDACPFDVPYNLPDETSAKMLLDN
ncbi:hypothetical protein KC366_g61 [Hortaea werneckii]|nr:hypothetical protein KC366_g61 [Hortaea werneckii]